MIWPLDRFRSWNRSRGLQNTFQVSVRTSASPRAVCAPQIQKVLECLASIIKFMIFRNLNFWIFKKPLTVIWTLKFFESFPDWSDPKRVCLYQLWGSRNPFWKSHTYVYDPLYCWFNHYGYPILVQFLRKSWFWFQKSHNLTRHR